MLFNSWEFLVFLLVTATLFYLRPRPRFQTLVLIAASFIFYGWHNPVLLVLLVLSIAINAVSSYLIYFGEKPGQRLFWAWTGVLINVGVLAFFKYSGLLYRTFSTLPADQVASDPVAHFFLTIPLPIGISFFTFQGISLVIDAYWARVNGIGKVEIPHSFPEHFIRTALFKSFFPQLVSGPIVKSGQFLPQIGVKYFRDIDWDYVFRSLTVGYFLKMVIADHIKDHTMWMDNPQLYSSATLLAMLYGYSMQIFADFAGYSLIALGTAALFGYRLPINFNFPYIASSVSEYWHRWHISLSTWFRDYLYMPLNLSISLGEVRFKSLLRALSLLLTFLVSGLWHGASWNYAAWGGVHGAALALEQFFSPAKRKRGQPKPFYQSGIFMALRTCLVFIFISFAWIIFRLPHWAQSKAYIHGIFYQTHYPDHKKVIFNIALYSIPVLIYHAAALISEKYKILPGKFLLACAHGAMLFLILFNCGSPGAFIYFQF